MPVVSPLTFAYWTVRPDIVSDNVHLYEHRHSERVLEYPIAEPYEPVVSQLLQGEYAPDVFYAQRGAASKWYAMDLIRPIDDLPGLSEIKGRMQTAVVEDSIAWDRRFLGLTYYNGGPFCLFRNEYVLSRAGLRATEQVQDYPRTWEEVERQALLVRNSGLSDRPLLMSWHNSHTGLPWNFIAQCVAEGEEFIDGNFAARFGPNSPVAKVLEDWQRWYALGLVPLDIFDWDDEQLRWAWMSGRYAFHPTLDYHSATYRNSRLSGIHAHNHMNPVMPGATGTPVLTGHPLLCISNRKRSDRQLDRVWSLVRSLGAWDVDGALTTHRRWARTTNFEVPFPEIYEEPETISTLRGWMYPPLADASLSWLLERRLSAESATLMRAPWYHDWDCVLHRTTIRVVRDRSIRPIEAATELRDLWESLRSRYMNGGAIRYPAGPK